MNRDGYEIIVLGRNVKLVLRIFSFQTEYFRTIFRARRLGCHPGRALHSAELRRWERENGTARSMIGRVIMTWPRLLDQGAAPGGPGCPGI